MKNNCYKKTLVLGIIVLFIGMSVIPSTATNIEVNRSSSTSLDGNTLYVGGSGPNNYSTIQSAIDANETLDGHTIIVDEGTYITPEDVENGKILVELDSSDLTEQLAQREIDFASAQASYAEAKEAYDIQLKQNESDITAAELKVKFGLMDLQKYLGAVVAESFMSKATNPETETDEVASLVNDTNLGGEIQGVAQILERIRRRKLIVRIFASGHMCTVLSHAVTVGRSL